MVFINLIALEIAVQIEYKHHFRYKQYSHSLLSVLTNGPVQVERFVVVVAAIGAVNVAAIAVGVIIVAVAVFLVICGALVLCRTKNDATRCLSCFSAFFFACLSFIQCFACLFPRAFGSSTYFWMYKILQCVYVCWYYGFVSLKLAILET